MVDVGSKVIVKCTPDECEPETCGGGCGGREGVIIALSGISDRPYIVLFDEPIKVYWSEFPLTECVFPAEELDDLGTTDYSYWEVPDDDENW
jgi:hypothetical protein